MLEVFLHVCTAVKRRAKLRKLFLAGDMAWRMPTEAQLPKVGFRSLRLGLYADKGLIFLHVKGVRA